MWKRLTDEMPPMNAHVLLYGKNTLRGGECMAVGYRDLIGGHPYWNAVAVSGWEWDFNIEPTHWMPLPEGPQ